MGLFVEKDNKSPQNTEEIKQYEIKGLASSKILFNFEKEKTFEHGDKLTNLIKARILDGYKKNSNTAPDTANYICFEIPTSVTLEELAERKIFDILNEYGKFSRLKPEEYSHIGFINKTVSEKFELYKPTNQVKSYVDNIMTPKILSNRDIFRKQIAVKQQEENKTIQEIFLEEELRYKIGNIVYGNYRGTDTVGGKILNICRVNKIEELDNENLYSAFIQKREKEAPLQLKTLQVLPSGQPVLFATQVKMEEIMQGNDKKMVKGFLDLLSNISLEKINVKKMQFIGMLNKNAEITRSDEACSEHIKNRIKEEQEKFLEENEKNKKDYMVIDER